MPRNKVSDDLDHVRKNPKVTKAPKGPPLKRWPLSKYTSLKIKKPWCNGQSQLSNHVASNDSYAIFCLFFDENTLKTLVQNTNKYAFLNPGPKKPETRT